MISMATTTTTPPTSATTPKDIKRKSKSLALPEHQQSKSLPRAQSYSSSSSSSSSLCYRPLPDILTDYFALTLCDLLPTKQQPLGEQRKAPELVYFIQRVTTQARISCHIAVVALIYIERCKEALPKNAIGDADTAHRIFVAALLVASKFLHGTTWASSQYVHNPEEDEESKSTRGPWLNNSRMACICSIYSLQQINQLECSFLNLIKHRCWVDSATVQAYLLEHRQDLLL
ncbi:hypothetical protein BCR43DRAFT_493000 [Syncephalastrum racemosum]|uniref:Cyclin N-terminal domain-containing protein n=1 Tax=Syncephalastrum racemosum TaxID=13706 RepID=A0A1X2H9W4_SYNRA|nr:hypothetical protein BCR43DRAFT_493000 [Syncephalastrum racemosum]